MFRTHITFEEDALLLDDERISFSIIEDANVEDGVLVLAIASGRRRVKLKSSEAMMVLDGVLDGIERAHPKTPYRTPGVAAPIPQEPAHHMPHLRRRTASVGSATLMIGRTFTAG
jgi:hypothetical protein